MRAKITAAAIVAALVLALVAAVRSCRSLRADRNRLLWNQSVLLHNGQVEIGKTSDGRSMTSVPAVTLRPREFSRSADALPRVARSMSVRPSRVTSAATVAAVTTASVVVPLQRAPRTTADRPPPFSSPDTLRTSASLPSPSGRPPMATFHWADPWITLRATIRDDSVDLTLRSADTLDIIVHRVPRRFLFFRFGCKAVRMNVSARNPHTRLVYARYYQITD